MNFKKANCDTQKNDSHPGQSLAVSEIKKTGIRGKIVWYRLNGWSASGKSFARILKNREWYFHFVWPASGVWEVGILEIGGWYFENGCAVSGECGVDILQMT